LEVSEAFIGDLVEGVVHDDGAWFGICGEVKLCGDDRLGLGEIFRGEIISSPKLI
jgi:hypothetical protein